MAWSWERDYVARASVAQTTDDPEMGVGHVGTGSQGVKGFKLQHWHRLLQGVSWLVVGDLPDKLGAAPSQSRLSAAIDGMGVPRCTVPRHGHSFSRL
jgi:hypothetical protein